MKQLLSEFARYLVSLKESGNTSEFDSVFRVVEDLHVDGDPEVREAATIGLLEGIQNNAEHAAVDPELFLTHLSPKTSAWWCKLNRFWNGDSTALSND